MTGVRSPRWGAALIVLGLAICAPALGIVPGYDPIAPAWIVLAAGLVFVFGGIAVAAPGRSRPRLLSVGAILAGFATIGLWVSLFAPAEGFAGGIPFLPRAVNIGIGRVLFGGGALICLLLLIPLWKGLRTTGARP